MLLMPWFQVSRGEDVGIRFLRRLGRQRLPLVLDLTGSGTSVLRSLGCCKLCRFLAESYGDQRE